MRLYDFIIADIEPILQAWEDFARGVETPMPVMDAKGLRNDAEYILRTVAADMRSLQSDQEQLEKSQSRVPLGEDGSAAQTHAVTRLLAGFTMDQMVSEYRALRSSVLRLWLAQPYDGNNHQVQDVIRFNEAIDQALVESIASYGVAVENTRKTVLAVLGHDLRSPLGAVMMAGGLLQKVDYLHERESMLAAQICASANRANNMVLDLLDLARCNVGTGIPVSLDLIDLRGVCSSIVEEQRTAFPRAQILLDAKDNIIGRFDASRLSQALSNLISNAVRHGDLSRPILVSLTSDEKAAHFKVHNHGEPIPPHAMPFLFKPEGRYSTQALQEKGPCAGLGLGLFIASEIVTSHDGQISVTSTPEQGTLFHVVIPIH